MSMGVSVFHRTRGYWLGLLVLVVTAAACYFSSQVNTVYGGDAGDFLSAIATRGIPHPPGYPLYTGLGLLISGIHIPGTLAYRIGFLSSIPALITLGILYDILFLLTKKLLPAIIASLTLTFVYPFWLYSITVEVFSLNNLFIIGLLWLAFQYHNTGKKKYLYASVFIFGLALTHHHLVFFLLPSLVYLIFKTKSIYLKSVSRLIILFLLGLTPFLYVIISAINNPAVNWLGTPTLTNLFNLIARTIYGTFMAGGFIHHTILARLFNLLALFDFIIKDFKIAGVILAVLGIFRLLRIRCASYTGILLFGASYLLFLFYASFPLSENFMLGTYERFILPFYIFWAICICFGLIQFQVITQNLINSLYHSSFLRKQESRQWIPGQARDDKEIPRSLLRPVLLKVSILMFLMIPASLFLSNYPKFSILKNDFSAENLGYDILDSVEENSILMISYDTPLFDSQYVYYAEKRWLKVKLIHFTKLFNPDYHTTLKFHYPELEVVPFISNYQKMLDSFIEANYSKFPIYSKQNFYSDMGVWIPQGLLYRFYKTANIPAKDEILQKNKLLWQIYHDPYQYSLSRYQNLMIADILKIYAYSRQETAFWLAKNGFLREAEIHLLEAIRLNPKDVDNYVILVQVYITIKDCQNAQKQLDKFQEINPEDPRIYYLQTLNFSLCAKDEKKAAQSQRMYEQMTKSQEIPLKKL